jgi:hypothetical protein
VPAADDVRPCPFCGEPIKVRAIKCRFCGEYLDEDEVDDRPRRGGGDASTEEGLKWLVPIGRSGWAIAAGYCGLFSCFPFLGALCGPLAILTGILALRHLRRDPAIGGKGRAIFGLVMGILFGLPNLAVGAILLYLAVTGQLK